MTRLPARPNLGPLKKSTLGPLKRPNLGQLKKQAKDLLTLYRNGDAEAAERIRAALAGRFDGNLRLHDAQSCIAREHGFKSWTELRSFVAAREEAGADPSALLRRLCHLIYAGDIAGGTGRAQPEVAARMLDDNPSLGGDDPYFACAVGDTETLARETARNPAWVNRPGGPLALPPLVAVTQSSLIRLPAYRDHLRAAAQALLEAGADPNQTVASRWSTTLDAPLEAFPLSALYGAAGQNHDPILTQLLLEHGANPNDGESLYHGLESPDCTRLLLAAGARITGTNALYRALDLDDVTPLTLLLANGGDANEPAPGPPTSDWGAPLLWAIRRRRSPAHFKALLVAGANPSARTSRGESAVTLALKFGLPEVAQLLREAGADESMLSLEDAFVAACARGDEAAARACLAQRPDLVRSLSERQQSYLPALAAEGAGEAVRLMVRLGWPIDVRGGDWSASALNHAVFHGDAALVRFLMEHGARWTEAHGFGDTVLGTLAWASCNTPVAGGDWPACAEVLQAYGLPEAKPDPAGPDWVILDGVRRRFSEDVAEILLTPPAVGEGQVAGEGGGG